MTTARKVVLIVATVMLVGGSALALGAFTLADFRFENLSNTTRDWVSSTQTLSTEAEAPHTAVVVRDASESVRFEPADGDAFEITYWTSSEKTVDVVDEGGVLEITGQGTSLTGLMIMKVDFQDRTTVVKVPRGYTGSITVETSGGNVDVANLDGLGTVSLTASSGSLSLMRTSAETVGLRTSRPGPRAARSPWMTWKAPRWRRVRRVATSIWTKCARPRWTSAAPAAASMPSAWTRPKPYSRRRAAE